KPTRNALELARRDFAALPRTVGARRRRPIGVVACDDSTDERAALRHLLDDVGSPAVIGFARGREAVTLIAEELLPHRALAMVTHTLAPQVTTLPAPPDGPRLVWRTTNSATQLALAIAALIEQTLEPKRKAERPGRFRVALALPRSVTGVGLSDTL